MCLAGLLYEVHGPVILNDARVSSRLLQEATSHFHLKFSIFSKSNKVFPMELDACKIVVNQLTRFFSVLLYGGDF